MKRVAIAGVWSVALSLAAGCTTSHQTTSPTAPTSPGPDSAACTFSAVQAPAFNASGGTGSATVTTQPNCRWTATPGTNSWIKIDGAPTFVGSATIPFAVEPNRSFTGRSGAIEIQADAGIRATQAITQRGAGCLYSVDPQKIVRPWLGTSDGSDVGGLELRVHAEPAECRWTATPNVQWMYLTYGSRSENTGDAKIYVAVLWNSAPSERVGEVVIAGLTGVNPDARLVVKQFGRSP